MFFHPVFKILIKHPDLIVEHASGYVSLVKQEMSATATEVVIKVVAWIVVAITGLLFLLLASMAIMLGCINEVFSWSLIVVPTIFMVIALVAFIWARRPLANEQRFAELRAQVDADIAALRLAGSGK